MFQNHAVRFRILFFGKQFIELVVTRTHGVDADGADSDLAQIGIRIGIDSGHQQVSDQQKHHCAGKEKEQSKP